MHFAHLHFNMYVPKLKISIHRLVLFSYAVITASTGWLKNQKSTTGQTGFLASRARSRNEASYAGSLALNHLQNVFSGLMFQAMSLPKRGGTGGKTVACGANTGTGPCYMGGRLKEGTNSLLEIGLYHETY
jgi:hypothetical protein